MSKSKKSTKTSSKKATTSKQQTTEPKAKKMGGLDAAAKVLAEAGKPMNMKEVVETALTKGYWTTGGKTPWATVYSAVIREIVAKGEQSRFRKTARGMFTANI